MSAREVAVVLLCFGGKKDASTHRRPLEEKLRSAGDAVLQTTILKVNEKQKASVHDPRRVLAGTLTAAVTWGLFGLVAGTNKVESTVIWAVVGAICGGLYAYTTEHVLTKSELARMGGSLAPNSSALLTYVETTDPAKALSSAAEYKPSTASVVAIDPDLGTHVLATTDATPGAAALSMLFFRYPDPKAAAEVAKRVGKGKAGGPQIELVIETDANGHRGVTDPTRGPAAWARSDVLSWGLFGVVVGAVAGAVGGGGFHGAVSGGVVTGLAWAVFGLVAGALYGLWAGRSISARRLKGVGSLLGNGTSAVLAWADGSVRPEALEAFSSPEAKQLVMRFGPVAGGALLEVEGSARAEVLA